MLPRRTYVCSKDQAEYGHRLDRSARSLAFPGFSMTAGRTLSVRSLRRLIRCAPLDSDGRSLKQGCQWQTLSPRVEYPAFIHIQRAALSCLKSNIASPTHSGRCTVAKLIRSSGQRRLRLQVGNDCQREAWTAVEITGAIFCLNICVPGLRTLTHSSYTYTDLVTPQSQ